MSRKHHLRRLRHVAQIVEPDLSLVPEARQGDARRMWDARDAEGLGRLCLNEDKPRFIIANAVQLKARGIYEAMVFALITCGTVGPMDNQTINWMLKDADPWVMRSTGDRLPSAPMHRLYRGIANHTAHAQIKRVSWTRSPEIAAWFAVRNANQSEHQSNPGVYTIDVPDSNVLCYTNARLEQEVFFRMWRGMRPTRLETLPIPRMTPDGTPLRLKGEGPAPIQSSWTLESGRWKRAVA